MGSPSVIPASEGSLGAEVSGSVAGAVFLAALRDHPAKDAAGLSGELLEDGRSKRSFDRRGGSVEPWRSEWGLPSSSSLAIMGAARCTSDGK